MNVGILFLFHVDMDQYNGMMDTIIWHTLFCMSPGLDQPTDMGGYPVA